MKFMNINDFNLLKNQYGYVVINPIRKFISNNEILIVQQSYNDRKKESVRY